MLIAFHTLAEFWSCQIRHFFAQLFLESSQWMPKVTLATASSPICGKFLLTFAIARIFGNPSLTSFVTSYVSDPASDVVDIIRPTSVHSYHLPPINGTLWQGVLCRQCQMTNIVWFSNLVSLSMRAPGLKQLFERDTANCKDWFAKSIRNG